MIAVDTNVLIRYLTNDDPIQARLAMQILAHSEGVFISKTVILETEWVLRAAFRVSRQAIEKALLTVVGLPQVTLESPGQIAAAIEYYRQGLDFADALHYVASGASMAFQTFDIQFAKKGKTIGLAVEAITDNSH
jgi:predicted nucleic-acid-binding protein